MRVSKLTLRNFKSFKEVSVPFRPFNVVIGPNASGKSNLVQAFQFLKDISDHGLKNAVSLQGGWEFLRNMAADQDEPVALSIEFGPPSNEVPIYPLSEDRGFNAQDINYTIHLKPDSSGNRLQVVRDRLSQRIRIWDMTSPKDPSIISEGSVSVSYKDGSPSFNPDFALEPQLDDLLRENIYPHFIERERLEEGVPVLGEPFFNILTPGPISPIDNISIYDFDSRLPKRGAPITGNADLDSNGGNLAIVLDDILGDAERRRTFHNLINDLLPHVEEVSVERFADNSQLIALRESYMPERDIPAPFLSDGTIGLTAMLVALAFEGNSLTILEEPDRNVHPRVISGLTEFMKDVSHHSQVMITTHNPEFVRYAGIENLILVHRDKDGVSQISRPADSEILKNFLSEEIGIHDMFVDDMIMIGV